MSKPFSAALLLGSVAVLSAAAEPQGPGSPGSTLPALTDTAGYSVYRYNDTTGKYTTTALPEEPAAVQPPPAMQTGRQLYGSRASPTREIEIESSGKRDALVQKELKSASGIAKGGATFYGLGLTVEVIGVIVMVNELSGYSGSNPPLTGLYVALGGGLTSFIGSIVAVSGGSKARNILEVSQGNAPPFYGWGYFWGGMACSAAGSLLTMSEVPAIPIVFSVTGFILNLSSIVHSVNYANRAYLRSVVVRDLRVVPMVDRHNFMPDGLMISGSL